MQELLRHAETDVSRQSIYIATSVIDDTDIVESHYSIDILNCKVFYCDTRPRSPEARRIQYLKQKQPAVVKAAKTVELTVDKSA